MFYSKSTNGFYNHEVNGENIPADKVEITEAYWQELLAGQTDGKVITADDTGYPVLTDPPPMSPELLAKQAETETAKQAGRDKFLALGLTLEEITAMGLRS